MSYAALSLSDSPHCQRRKHWHSPVNRRTSAAIPGAATQVCRYTGNGGLYPIYQCNWRHREALSRQACMNVASKPLDDAIAERLETAATPLTIELALKALPSLEAPPNAHAAQRPRRHH